MAKRETAKERNDRYERERAEEEARLTAEYPTKLVDALHRGLRLCYDFSVNTNGDFCVNPLGEDEEWSHHTYCFGKTYTWANGDNLDSFVSDMDRYEARVAKEARLREVRKEVLARLSDEEREALGL